MYVRNCAVIDVYSSWCGPTVAALGTLRKIKTDASDDLLVMALVGYPPFPHSLESSLPSFCPTLPVLSGMFMSLPDVCVFYEYNLHNRGPSTGYVSPGHPFLALPDAVRMLSLSSYHDPH